MLCIVEYSKVIVRQERIRWFIHAEPVFGLVIENDRHNDDNNMCLDGWVC